MGVAEHLVGHTLKGQKTKSNWTVVERIPYDREDRYGMFHSIGYRVRSDQGQLAFMKVTDLDLLTDENSSMLERLQAAIQAHTFERKILDHCRGNNMDRIVVALDYGDAMVANGQGREPIFYLVFELADGDVRVQVDRRNRFDIAWTMGALHDLANAIQQLHAGEVTHNDIKPGNFLVFKDLSLRDRLQKLADLGCATSPLIASIYDDAIYAGDPRYAPPEFLYADDRQVRLRSFEARRCADIYHLGSMIFFLVTGCMLSPEIVRRMTPEMRPPNDRSDWTMTFDEVLPFWREAFARTIEEFRPRFPGDENGQLSAISIALIEALKQLGEPNPNLRGHPHNRVGHLDRLSVQQYVTLFDYLRRRALH